MQITHITCKSYAHHAQPRPITQSCSGTRLREGEDDGVELMLEQRDKHFEVCG